MPRQIGMSERFGQPVVAMVRCRFRWRVIIYCVFDARRRVVLIELPNSAASPGGPHPAADCFSKKVPRQTLSHLPQDLTNKGKFGRGVWHVIWYFLQFRCFYQLAVHVVVRAKGEHSWFNTAFSLAAVDFLFYRVCGRYMDIFYIWASFTLLSHSTTLKNKAQVFTLLNATSTDWRRSVVWHWISSTRAFPQHGTLLRVTWRLGEYVGLETASVLRR